MDISDNDSSFQTGKQWFRGHLQWPIVQNDWSCAYHEILLIKTPIWAIWVAIAVIWCFTLFRQLLQNRVKFAFSVRSCQIRCLSVLCQGKKGHGFKLSPIHNLKWLIWHPSMWKFFQMGHFEGFHG